MHAIVIDGSELRIYYTFTVLVKPSGRFSLFFCLQWILVFVLFERALARGTCTPYTLIQGTMYCDDRENCRNIIVIIIHNNQEHYVEYIVIIVIISHFAFLISHFSFPALFSFLPYEIIFFNLFIYFCVYRRQFRRTVKISRVCVCVFTLDLGSKWKLAANKLRACETIYGLYNWTCWTSFSWRS